MLLDYFEAARRNLAGCGLKPRIHVGKRVSVAEVACLDRQKLAAPQELKEFYLELGDGFHFIPNDDDESLVGWEHMRMSDHILANKDFEIVVEQDAMGEINASKPRVDPALIREEMNRRKYWMPFYGFVGSGDYLCLDLSSKPHAVRFYEQLYWRCSPATWDFVIASTLDQFVYNWSKFSFISPGDGWTSHSQGLSGKFDWSDKDVRKWHRVTP